MNPVSKILLVDDNDLVRRALSCLLVFEGFEVVECNSGRQACAAFANECPDLVITDLLMPGMSGVEVITEIRQLCSTGRFLVMTGGGGALDVDLPRRAREAGAAAVMKKPVDNDEFLMVVKELLYQDC